MSKSNKQQVPKVRFTEFSGDWEKDILGKTKDVRDGTHDSPKLISEGYPLVTSKNLKENGLDMSDISYISEADYKSINKRSEVTIGDILFAMIGTIGNPIIIKQDNFAIKNVALIKNTGTVSNEFLLPLLKSDVFEKYIYIENAGNTQKFLALGKIREFSFHVPTTNEQIQIGNFFQQLDKLIELQTRAVESAETYKKAMLQKMFPQKGEKVPRVRFEGFSGDWEEKTIGDIADIKRGASPRPISDPKWFNDSSSIGWVRISDVTRSFRILEKTEQYLSAEGVKRSRFIKSGSIIMSICATIGKPVYTAFDVCIHDGFVVFDSLKIDEDYTLYFLQTIQEKWYQYGQPGTQVNLNSDIVSQEKIVYPSVDEQVQVGKFFQKLDQNIESEKKKLEQYKTMKRALLQRMFV